MIPNDLRVVQVNCDAAALLGCVRRQVPSMSVLKRITDLSQTSRHVRKVPFASVVAVQDFSGDFRAAFGRRSAAKLLAREAAWQIAANIGEVAGITE